MITVTAIQGLDIIQYISPKWFGKILQDLVSQRQKEKHLKTAGTGTAPGLLEDMSHRVIVQDNLKITWDTLNIEIRTS